MAVKKYIVTESLNIRKYKNQLREDNIVGVLEPGFIIDAVDEVIGDEFRGSNVWLKDANGFFYWKGGVELYGSSPPSASATGDPPISIDVGNVQDYIDDFFDEDSGIVNGTIDYRRLVKLNGGGQLKGPPSWLSVGIFDHRLNNEPLFSLPIERTFTFDPAAVRNHHGMKVAGVIAGSSQDIIGMLPGVRMIELPFFDTKGHPNHDLLEQAIKDFQKIKDSTPNLGMITVVSQDLFREGMSDSNSRWEDLFSEWVQFDQNLVFASAGTDDELLEGALDQLPAYMENVISVGSATKSFLKNNRSNFATALDIIIPEIKYASFGRYKRREPFSQDSAANAIAAGIIGACWPRDQELSRNYFTKLLDKISYKSGDFDDTEIMLINPKKM